MPCLSSSLHSWRKGLMVSWSMHDKPEKNYQAALVFCTAWSPGAVKWSAQNRTRHVRRGSSRLLCLIHCLLSWCRVMISSALCVTHVQAHPALSPKSSYFSYALEEFAGLRPLDPPAGTPSEWDSCTSQIGWNAQIQTHGWHALEKPPTQNLCLSLEHRVQVWESSLWTQQCRSKFEIHHFQILEIVNQNSLELFRVTVFPGSAHDNFSSRQLVQTQISPDHSCVQVTLDNFL